MAGRQLSHLAAGSINTLPHFSQSPILQHTTRFLSIFSPRAKINSPPPTHPHTHTHQNVQVFHAAATWLPVQSIGAPHGPLIPSPKPNTATLVNTKQKPCNAAQLLCIAVCNSCATLTTAHSTMPSSCSSMTARIGENSLQFYEFAILQSALHLKNISISAW